MKERAVLLVGLGNPGKEYENTRHNAGFAAVDAIADEVGAGSFKAKFSGQFSAGNLGDKKVFLLKPETYMNLSGGSVQKALSFYKMSAEDVIVFHDDIDLVLGKVRVKIGGGHGGHNGLRDIDTHIGRNYKRVRIGVGRPEGNCDVKDYVLKTFLPGEIGIFNKIIQEVAKNISLIISNFDDKFMTNMASCSRSFVDGEVVEKEK